MMTVDTDTATHGDAPDLQHDGKVRPCGMSDLAGGKSGAIAVVQPATRRHGSPSP